MIKRGLLLLWIALCASALLAEQPGTDVRVRHEAAIASANKHATQAGLTVLEQGGNAFDAAVAVSAALSVVEPESSGLGGGGFFLLYRASDKKAVFVDAREKAPASASRDMYLDADKNVIPRSSIDGARAAGVPGLPAGLAHVAEHYGRLSLAQSLAPAIKLASDGFPFGNKNRVMLGYRAKSLSPAAAKLYLRGGEVAALGETIRNPDLAAVLRALGKSGAASFYQGDFAKRFSRGVIAAGGLISVEDLAAYQVVEREPIRLQYGGYDVITAPPPSSGGIALAEILNMIGPFEIAQRGSVARTHVLVEAMRRAYRDRSIYLGDPDQVQMPMDMLLSPYYAAGLRASISLERATPSASLPGTQASGAREDTTHFSIVDADGSLAAVTQTVNLPYGSGVVIAGTGFMLNNQMDDFSIKAMTPNAFGLVGQDANAIAPGKRPLSSMTPTIMLGKDRTAVIGTPGGSRIITMVLLGLLAVADGLDADAIAKLPRIHHQYLPDEIGVEPGALTPETIAGLEALGHTVKPSTSTWGNMNVVLIDHRTGKAQAASDPRWTDGGAGTKSADELPFR